MRCAVNALVNVVQSLPNIAKKRKPRFFKRGLRFFKEGNTSIYLPQQIFEELLQPRLFPQIREDSK